MTELEAIDVLVRFKQNNLIPREVSEAIDVAADSLEIAAPLEPVIFRAGHRVAYKCPNCYGAIIDGEDDFCRLCGQSLDWSKVRRR